MHFITPSWLGKLDSAPKAKVCPSALKAFKFPVNLSAAPNDI